MGTAAAQAAQAMRMGGRAGGGAQGHCARELHAAQDERVATCCNLVEHVATCCTMPYQYSANIAHRLATQQRRQLQKTTAAFKGLHSLHTRMVPAMKEHFALSREARHWH